MTAAAGPEDPPRITVEFFGIPRRRAGCERVVLRAATLGQALQTLANEYPSFAESCLDGERLRPGVLANIDGRRFTTDLAAPLADGESVLILSADVGG